MKAREITNKEINKICKQNTPNCEKCPLRRINKETKKLAWCHKKVRAYYYSEMEWLNNVENTEQYKEEQKQLLKADLEKVNNEDLII